MAARGMLAALVLGAVLVGAPHGSRHRRWEIYENEMQTPVDDPADAWEKTEFAFARLRFRSPYRGYYQRWGIDTNKSDRLFSTALRRLTRIHVRSVEEIIDIDSDEIYSWPFLYAVAAGDMVLSDSHAARLREYFARGGFLMVDDFHGEPEWADFMGVIRRVLPGHQVIDLEEDAPIFHVVYDLTKRVRVPGANVVYGGQVERGGSIRTGARSWMRRDACRWRSASTWIWATPGNSPTIPSIPRCTPHRPSAWASTTSCTR